LLENPDARGPTEKSAELVDGRVDEVKVGWRGDGARRLSGVPDAGELHRLAALRREGAAGAPQPAGIILEETLDPG